MARAPQDEGPELGMRVYYRATLTREPLWPAILGMLLRHQSLLEDARFELKGRPALTPESAEAARRDILGQFADTHHERLFAARSGVAVLEKKHELSCQLAAGERDPSRLGEFIASGDAGDSPRRPEASNCVSLTLRGERARSLRDAEPLAALLRDLGSLDAVVCGGAWYEPRPRRRILFIIETHVISWAYTSDGGPYPPRWLLLLGPEYRAALAARIETARCAAREELPVGAVLLRTSERPDDATRPARALAKHLGPEWFTKGAPRDARKKPAVDWSGSHYTSSVPGT